MGNCNNIKRALHNESVCNYLSKKQDFGDWIITTAFYSALHFTRHKLLPVEHTNKDGTTETYNDFETWYRTAKREYEGRHGFQIRMVKDRLVKIDFEYARLHEASENARYKNQDFDRKHVNQLKEYLSTIKRFCHAL
jgi:hypothetical protein